MKAVLLLKAGGVENLQLQEIERPAIMENEVLVNVKAISLNPADVKAKQSDEMLTRMFGSERPLILGWDIAGIISEVGDKVSDLKIGDKVFGMVNFPGVGKAYAEYVASPDSHLAKIPDGTSFEEAAATTLAALTAYQILKDKVKQGDKVFIQGGSGGVGHFAIQIAKSMGAMVTTTASGKNKDFVLSIGADEHINYQNQKFEETISDMDFVLDIFGGKILENSLKVVKKGGQIFTTTGPPSEDVQKIAKELGVHVSPMLVESNGVDMNTLSGMLKACQIKPNLHKVFTIEDMKAAHTEVEKGSIIGKVIVTI